MLENVDKSITMLTEDIETGPGAQFTISGNIRFLNLRR